MKKSEFIALLILVVISSCYSFVMPNGTVENIAIDKSININISGLINTSLTFDELPKIKDVFKELKIENKYSFDNELLLSPDSELYIPKNNNLISLNKAKYDDFLKIKGIGPVMASKIIEYQETTGYKTIEDLMNISGIGYKKYIKFREYVML